MLCVVHTTNVFSYGKCQYLLEDETKMSASNKHKESCGYVGMEEGGRVWYAEMIAVSCSSQTSVWLKILQKWKGEILTGAAIGAAMVLSYLLGCSCFNVTIFQTESFQSTNTIACMKPEVNCEKQGVTYESVLNKGVSSGYWKTSEILRKQIVYTAVLGSIMRLTSQTDIRVCCLYWHFKGLKCNVNNYQRD